MNALDAALRGALLRHYPTLARLELANYKVRILNPHTGTGAITRVILDTGDGHDQWATVGVSANIIEASWDALVESLTYGLRLRAAGPGGGLMAGGDGPVAAALPCAARAGGGTARAGGGARRDATRGRRARRGGVLAALAVPARPRPHRPRQGVPPVEAQDAGLHAPEGDHYRTRLTHTLEVARSRAPSRAPSAERGPARGDRAGHDLGHPPFGHAGEQALSGRAPSRARPPLPPQRALAAGRRPLERDGRGLNLTAEVRDGILNHTGRTAPPPLEGRVVKIVDRVAYINHDIDDAVRAGVLDPERLPPEPLAMLGDSASLRVDPLVHDLVEAIGRAPATSSRHPARPRDARVALVHVRGGLPAPEVGRRAAPRTQRRDRRSSSASTASRS